MSLQPVDGIISHGDTFKHSVPIRAGAYWVLCSGCVLLAVTRTYPFRVYAIVLITLLESVILLIAYRRAVASRTWAASYLALEAVCQTMIFHVSGDLRIAFAPIVYTFELLN